MLVHSVRIYADGRTMRLSIDLLIELLGEDLGDFEFLFSYVVKGRKIKLIPTTYEEDYNAIKGWKPHARAASMQIPATRMLNSLGISNIKAPGEYSAEIKSNCIEIDFSYKL